MSKTIRNTTSRDYALARELREGSPSRRVAKRIARAQSFGLRVTRAGDVVTRHGTVVGTIYQY